jgi:hypothetical protein
MTIESVRRFCKVMIFVFGLMYLWAPNEEYTMRLMMMNEERGWPQMLGSIDCILALKELPDDMAWAILRQESWSNNRSWGSCFRGTMDLSLLFLDCWFSQWYQCVANVSSTCLLASGDTPVCNYTINGHEYNMGYYLTEAYTRRCAMFVKTNRLPKNWAEAKFALLMIQKFNYILNYSLFV